MHKNDLQRMKKYGLHTVHWHDNTQEGQHGSFLRALQTLVRFWNAHQLIAPPQWIVINISDTVRVLTKNMGATNVSIQCIKDKKGTYQARAFATWTLEDMSKELHPYQLRVYTKALLKQIFQSKNTISAASQQQRDQLGSIVSTSTLAYPQGFSSQQSLLRQLYVTDWPNRYSNFTDYYKDKINAGTTTWTTVQKAWIKKHTKHTVQRLSIGADATWLNQVQQLPTDTIMRIASAVDKECYYGSYHKEWKEAYMWMVLNHMRSRLPHYRSAQWTFIDSTFETEQQKNKQSTQRPIRYHVFHDGQSYRYVYGMFMDTYEPTIRHVPGYYQHRMIRTLTDDVEKDGLLATTISLSLLQDCICDNTNRPQHDLTRYIQGIEDAAKTTTQATNRWLFHLIHMKNPQWNQALETAYHMLSLLNAPCTEKPFAYYLEKFQVEQYRHPNDLWKQAFDIYCSVVHQREGIELSIDALDL